jgi:hypothetical protein
MSAVDEVLARIGPPPRIDPPVTRARPKSLVTGILAEKARFIPESGFNLVGFDWFELPGEKLYLIDHFDTRAEAEAALAKRGGGHDDTFIYGPDDL